jgi:hypothetical protein
VQLEISILVVQQDKFLLFSALILKKTFSGFVFFTVDYESSYMKSSIFLQLEDIMLSEVSQDQKHKSDMFSLICER